MAPPGASQLPAGVVEINRQNYMLVTTTQTWCRQTSRLVKAEAAQGRWPTVPESHVTPASGTGGSRRSAATTTRSPRRIRRAAGCTSSPTTSTAAAPVALYRVPPKAFTDRASGRAGRLPAGWNKPPTPLWGDRLGEMSIRQIDGKTVLSYFNASTGNMEVRVADDPTGLGTAPVTTVVFAGDWPRSGRGVAVAARTTDSRSPTAGYISPGSTLDELRVFVSQWNTGRAATMRPIG